MTIVRAKLQKTSPPRLSTRTKSRINDLTDKELTDAARGDSDNPPLTNSELARLRTARAVQRARAATGLSQSVFAERFRINPARLRDWEQGRTMPDSAALAYLKVIEREAKFVARVLARS